MIASVLHRAAGLTIAADRPLPGFVLMPDPSVCAEDVRIHLEGRPPWHAAEATVLHPAGNIESSAEPTVIVSRSEDGFHFVYGDGTRAWIHERGADVWCTWPPSASLADTATYLYGPILGLVLRLRGALAFHASAVQVGAGAIGFAGPHGAGKSTLAAALAMRGCPVITDDILHVRREGPQWLAQPFATMLKLWPEGAMLAIRDVDLPRIVDGWEKRALAPGDGIHAVSDPLPLIALGCFTEPASTPEIQPISPGAALVRLAANTSAAHLLDREMRATEFHALAALVRDVPCVLVTPPADAREHPRFADRVLTWGQELSRGAG